MRTHGSPDELERRRQAVQRVLEGYAADEVAELLDVAPRTVWRWLALYRGEGSGGAGGSPRAGPTPQAHRHAGEERPAMAARDPTEHGFPTELRTAPRLAKLIQQEFGIPLNPRYLNASLRGGFNPQKPQRVPRGRDP
jgi:transposase